MIVHLPHRPVRPPGPATPTPSPRPLWWLAGGAVLAFVTAWFCTDVLGLHHDLYYLIYLTVVLGFLAEFVRHTRVAWRTVLRRRLGWSLAVGVVVGALAVRQAFRQDGTTHPGGAYFAFEVAWRGVVYGTVDALILFVFPALVAYLVLHGDRTGLRRKTAFAGLTLLFSMIVTATYHLGYPEFRGSALVKPEVGAVLMNIPTVATGNPAGAIVAHATAHVGETVHLYQGSDEHFLPPELDAGYPENLGGGAGRTAAVAWIVAAAATVVTFRARRRRS